jgi:hypothetical protein
MSLLGWIAEARGDETPDSGASDVPERRPRSQRVVEGRGAFAISLVATVVLFIVLLADGMVEMLGGILGLAIYLCLGYVFRPKPNLENLGWFGGLMDNPFRLSDGYNRFLVWLFVLFLPGRFVSTSIVDLFLPTAPDWPPT